MRSDIVNISKNTSIQLVGKLISSLTTIASTVVITRALGVGGYGDFIKALSLVTIFYIIVDFGFNPIIIKKLTSKPAGANLIISKLIGIRVLMALSLIALLLLVSLFLPYDLVTGQGFNPTVKAAILAGSILILTQAGFHSFNAIFQYKLRYDQSVISSSIGSIITLGLVLLVVRLWPSVLLVMAANVVGGVIMVLASFSLAKNLVGPIFVKIDFGFLKQILPQVLPLGISLIFNLIYFRVDTLVLSATRPTEEVAYYGIAYKIFETTLVLPIFLVNSAYPLLITAINTNRQRFFNLIKITSIVLFTSACIIAILIFLFSDLIVLVIGGQEFLESVIALKILAISIPIFYISAQVMWLYVSLKLEKFLVLIYGSGAIVNIILNLIFIPKYGFVAAAIITGISELLILITSLVILFLNRLRFKIVGVGFDGT